MRLVPAAEENEVTHLKRLILGIISAVLLALAGAGTAAAETTELYSAGTTLSSPTLVHGTLEPESTFVEQSTSGALTTTCGESTFIAKTLASTGATISMSISALNWGKCTHPAFTITNGSFAITKIAGTDNGTLSGAATTITTEVSGVSCLYTTGTGTTLGTVTGKTGATEHATVDIDAVINEEEPKKILCPDTVTWAASYLITSPTALNVRT